MTLGTGVRIPVTAITFNCVEIHYPDVYYLQCFKSQFLSSRGSLLREIKDLLSLWKCRNMLSPSHLIHYCDDITAILLLWRKTTNKQNIMVISGWESKVNFGWSEGNGRQAWRTLEALNRWPDSVKTIGHPGGFTSTTCSHSPEYQTACCKLCKYYLHTKRCQLCDTSLNF